MVNKDIRLSIAQNRKSTNLQQITLNWGEFYTKLKVPVQSTETLVEFLRLNKTKQDDLKDVGGFTYAQLKDGRRRISSVVGMDFIALDMDNILPGETQNVLNIIRSIGLESIVYSTRKHEGARPRLRCLFLVDRTMHPDEYEPTARYVANAIGINMCDPTTFDTNRIYYWPSVCRGAEYVCERFEGNMLSVDGVLATYRDWRDVSEWPRAASEEENRLKTAAKQADPTEKKGIVGAFCRVYDVEAVIEKFLPGVYESAGEGRYTYTGGSTAGGAIVYGDGKFLFSHHATDPAGGMLSNSFDLVRLHKFGELDGDSRPNTPVHKLPSYKAMGQFAAEDSDVKHILLEDRYQNAIDEFSTTSSNHTEPVEDINTDWLNKLKLNSNNGSIEKTIDNIVIILENDTLLQGKMALDEFAVRGMVLGDVPWNSKKEPRLWTDVDSSGLYHYVEKVYGISTETKVNHALRLVSYNHKYNSVKQYLESCVWDGKSRIDTLFIDYLGAEDNVYTRAVARKSLVAAVARAVEEKCVKYDSVPILVGKQGIGKSTFLKILARDWFSDSLQSFEGKDAVEIIQGVWINEIGELQGLLRSEANVAKQFLSKEFDIYRVPYGRQAEKFPRRCVFFGTTNDSDFLKDKTGNRRYLPITTDITKATKSIFSDLEKEVDSIWGEAVAYWKLGESLYLEGEAKEIAEQSQEQYRESNAKEGIIYEFVNRKIPANWRKLDIETRRMFYSGHYTYTTELIHRDRICAAEVWCECFGKNLSNIRRSDSAEINAILANIPYPGWEKDRSSRQYGVSYGVQKGFNRIEYLKNNNPDDTMYEIKNGHIQLVNHV